MLMNINLTDNQGVPMRHIGTKFIVLFILLYLGIGKADNEACFDCHSDEDLDKLLERLL